MSFRLLRTNYLFFWEELDGNDSKLGMYPDESPGRAQGARESGPELARFGEGEKKFLASASVGTGSEVGSSLELSGTICSCTWPGVRVIAPNVRSEDRKKIMDRFRG